MINGEMVGEAKEKADALLRNYLEVYTPPRLSNVEGAISTWADPERQREVQEVEISEARIKEVLMKLPVNSAPGPDGVPSVLLKRCAAPLARPLARLWSASWTAGYVPSALQEGTITPIFKGGDKGQCENYRQVVLTSHVTKVFERLVAEVMEPGVRRSIERPAARLSARQVVYLTVSPAL